MSSAAPAAKLCAHESQTCQLPAGTYAAAPFEPSFTFTVAEDGWTNHRAWPHGGGVGYDDGAFWWMAGASKGMVGDKTVRIGDGAEGVLSHLKRFGDWKIGKPQPITIDGVSGISVDVVTGAQPRPQMMVFPEDVFNTDPGERIRWIVLEKDGQVVQFLLDAFKKRNYDQVSSRLQPIVDSVTWS